MSSILLINHYATTPATAMGGRTHYMARELARLGHDVTVVTAKKHHYIRDGVDADALPAEEEVDGYRLLRLDVPSYSNAQDRRRILAWFVFARKLPGLRRRLVAQPDAVIYSSPQLIGYLGAERLARACEARLIFEVRDIWPLTLTEIGGHSPRHPFIRFMQWIEDRAYAHADRVVSNLEGAVEYMVTRGMDRNKFTWVSNGIAVDDATDPAPLRPELSARIPANGLRVVYTGTLGTANALDTLIEAASLLRDMPDIHILLVGQGRVRADLEALCDALELTNVRFIGSVPKAQVQSVLAACDVCFIGWHSSPLYRWGIAANKVFDYLYSGKPTIHAFSGGNDPFAKFAAGLSVPAEDPKALADAIRRMHNMSKAELRRMGENGRHAALEHFDYAKLARRLEQVLLD